MPGYSDRLQHALTYAIKHAPPAQSDGRWVPAAPALAGPGVALVLARHGAHEAALVAAILRPVASQGRRGAGSELGNKFGMDVARILHTVEPIPPGWAVGLGGADARAHALSLAAGADEGVLDLLVGEALLACGPWAATARRLGPEYLTGSVPLTRAEALAWLVQLACALEARAGWPRAALCAELRRLGAELVRSFPPDAGR